MRKNRLMLVAGWAHTAGAMKQVAALLEPRFAVEALAFADLMAAGTDQAQREHEKDAGQSDVISTYARGLRAILEAHDHPAVLVGWSAGGMAALEAAAHWAGLVKGLVLVGGTAKFCSGRGYKPGISEHDLRAMIMQVKRQPLAVLDRFYRNASWPAEVPESLRSQRAQEACRRGIDLLADGLEYLRKTDLRLQIKQIKIPALLIHGREDRIIPWRAGDWLSKTLADSRLMIREAVGHDIPERQPEMLASEIETFVENLP